MDYKKVLRKNLPRLGKFRALSGFLGQIRFGLPKGFMTHSSFFLYFFLFALEYLTIVKVLGQKVVVFQARFCRGFYQLFFTFVSQIAIVI